MKLILALLLAMGLAFAGTAFPQTIPGTGLEIISDDTTGDLQGGEAYYKTSDSSWEATVVAEPMGASDWQVVADDYDSVSLPKATAGQISYYYLCESEEGEERCFVDIYEQGIYYTVDVSTLDANEAQVLQTVDRIIASLFEEDVPIGQEPEVSPPLPPEQTEETGQPPANQTEEDDKEPDKGTCICLPALVMLLAGAFAFSKRN